jgi:hypothetical protein
MVVGMAGVMVLALTPLSIAIGLAITRKMRKRELGQRCSLTK